MVHETHVLTFDVDGVPRPAPRPRVVLSRGRAHAYRPSSADAWMRAVRDAATATGAVARAVAEVPVRVVLSFRMPRLNGGGDGLPITGADLDNLAKSVLDAMIDARMPRQHRVPLLFCDDAQVVDLHVVKRYAAASEQPGVRVTVYRIEP